MNLQDAAHEMDAHEFNAYVVCQSKARYDDGAVADRAAHKIRNRAAKVTSQGGPGAPNMHSYLCQFDFDGPHYHLTRGRG